MSLEAAGRRDAALGEMASEESRRTKLADFKDSVRTTCQDARQARQTTLMVLLSSAVLAVLLRTMFVVRSTLAPSRREDPAASDQEACRAELP